MRRAKLGSIIMVAAMCVAAAYLVAAGLRSSWVYYVGVEEVLGGTVPHGQPVRVHGVVASEGLDVRPSDLIANFGLRGERGVLRVDYHGPIPERLLADREVVVEGRLGADGRLCATTVLTKCASRYTAKPDRSEAPDSPAQP